MPAEGWKSTDDACAHCGISKNTLYKLVALGQIPAYKPSRSFRFRTADLDAYLESVRVRPQDVLQLLPKSVRDELQADASGNGRCSDEDLDELDALGEPASSHSA